MNRTVIAIVLALMLVPSFAAAWTADDIALSGTIGSGTKTSYLIVDFGSASYAFNYLWDGTVTGEGLILALTDSTTGVSGLTVGYTIWPGMGLSVDSFSYGGHSGAGAYPDPWWNYWMGNAGTAQESSWVGCSSRELSDGSIDSWVFSADWEQAPSIPGVSEVPEPSSLLALCSLIGLVGSAKLLRRPRK